MQTKKQFALKSLLLISLAAAFFIYQTFDAKAATVGLTTQGSAAASAPNTLAASQFTMPNENGTVTSMSVYFSTAAAAPNNQYQVAIYSNNGGTPGNLVAASATGTIGANSWNTLSVSASLTANTVYWLALNSNGTSAANYNAAGAGASYYHAQAFGTMPASFGAGTPSTTQISIYATYTPAGAPVDTTPPTVSISSPSASSTISGTTSITANASDNVGIGGVQFRIDGANVGAEDTSIPYAYTWDTTTSSNVAHTLTAVARDTSGNLTTSATITVTVSNTITPPPPPPPPPASGSWIPPIGIPNPQFGINETVASLHGGNANFRTKTVSGGGNLNTLMPALVPGDVLVIESGTYTITGGTTWNHAGTVNSPIIIRGPSSTSKPVIRIISSQNNLHLSGSYVIYENLDFDISSLGDTGVDLSGNHISFRDSEVRNGIGTTHTALFLGGTYNVAYRNKIHDNGPLGSAGDIDFHGMGASGDHHWIVDNEIYRNAGDGMQLNPGNAASARSLHHIFVGRNDSWGNQQAGFWIKFSEDIIFSQNKSHGHRPSDSSSGQGMGFQYGSERAWFLYNQIYDNITGILIASDGGPGGNGNGLDSYFIGNVIENNTNNGILSWETSSRKHVVNNTIYGSNVGIDFFNARNGTEIVNNILANIATNDMDLSSNGGGTFSNNLCDTACAVIQATCASCFAGNPAFVDIDGADNIPNNPDDNFQLSSSSAAINRGIVSNVYNTFQVLYGLNIAVDYANASRPSGSAWDIGAYEFGGTPTTPPPPPPTPTLPTATISVAPTSITSGLSATLTWSSTNATSVSINQGIGTVAASGTRSVNPTVTTTYTITATNTDGTVTASTTLTVGAAANQLPTGTFDGVRTDGITLYGWSYDPDANTSPINVQIFVNGPVGTGTLIGTVSTTFTRTDVNSNFGITGTHGFELVIPTQYRDGAAHNYYAYGIDFNDSTRSTLLGGSPRSITAGGTNPPSGSWTAPIGIPTPNFGILEQAPAAPNPWTSEVANYYYIDRNIAGATDTNNNFGTPSRPRMSVPRTLAAGSVVEIHGTYTFTHVSPNTITSNGTANAPVFIRGVSINQRPVVTNCFQVNGNYAIIENIEFNLVTACGSRVQVSLMSGSSHLSIRNSDIHGNLNAGGLSVGGSSFAVTYNNYIHDNGDVNATFDQDIHGIAIGTGTNNLWVVDNEIARNSGDGTQVNGNSYIDTDPTTTRTHLLYFGRNRVHHNKQVAFGTKQATDVIYSQNIMYSHRSSGSSQGGCTSVQYGPERVWFLYNDCYDSERGFSFAGRSGPDGPGVGQNLYIIGNVVHNIHSPSGADLTDNPWKTGAAFYLSDEIATKYIINNTVYDADVGITNPRGTDGFQGFNNIFTNIIAEDVFIESGSQTAASSMNNNLFDSTALIKWGDFTPLTLTQFRNTYPTQCSNCREANPLLVNAAGNDFHLQSSSPAINAGTVNNVYNTFQSMYGLNISLDFDRSARPSGSAWDMGAYEFGGTPTTPPPPPPTPP
ncbi:MAG: right-handed parallel beta-helix repeat-containing protein, partial [Candidatus Doudnabacteria bacterium]|nr:right-handed parallel beta-helix repeat-containing protein [Candidatus Doudnabacteria bacterium]